MDGLKPGRVVYYRDYLGKDSPAIVTRVHSEDGCINLSVIADGASSLRCETSVVFSQDPQPNTWHWMFEGQQTRYRPDRVETTAS